MKAERTIRAKWRCRGVNSRLKELLLVGVALLADIEDLLCTGHATRTERTGAVGQTDVATGHGCDGAIDEDRIRADGQHGKPADWS